MKKPKAKPAPQVKAFLDAEERAVFKAVERESYTPKNLLNATKRSGYEAMARSTMNEGRVKISLRLPESDLER